MRLKQPKKRYEELTVEKARLISHLIGDGCVYNHKGDYNIKYEVSDKQLLDLFYKDLLKVYGLKPFTGTNPSGKTGKLISYVRLRSRKVYDDLLRYTSYFSEDWKINKEIKQSSLILKKEFLRAFFDDEGSVIPEGEKAIIRLYSINLLGLKQIREILSEFKIETHFQKGFGLKRNVHALVIKDIKRFDKLIGFNLKRKQEKLKEFL